MRPLRRLVGVLVVLCALAALGCGGKTGLSVFDEPGAAPPLFTFDAGTLDSGAPDTGVPEVDAGLPDVGAPDAWVPCPDSVRVRATEASIPVDIIWSIDSSGSMLDDIRRMNENINLFWDAMVETSLDVHVIFITPRGNAPGAPAGFSGRFAIVDREVRSYEAMSIFLTAWDDYKNRLRPDAITHFVAVTDDESMAIDAVSFIREMTALLGHDFYFHAVASERITPTDWNPLGACFSTDGGTAWAPGLEYYAAAELTGGLAQSICNDDWSELYGHLTERIAVRIPLPCAYTVPTLPRGATPDPTTMTILWTPDGASDPQALPQVPSAWSCGLGWSWFGPSRRIELCDATCAELEAGGGRVEIDLGCDDATSP